MANETNKSTLNETIIDFLEQQTIETANQLKVFRPVLAQSSPRSILDFSGPGDNKDIVQRSGMTFAALTEWNGTGNTTNTALDPTKRTLSPVLIGCHFQMSYEADAFSSIDPMQMIADEAATAWAQAEDSAATISFAANYADAPSSAPDHVIGTTGVPMDAALIRNAVQLLMTAKARPPFNLFIDPLQWGELMQDALAISLLKDGGAQPAGFRAVEGVRLDQFVGKLFGCNIWCVPGGMITASSAVHAIMCGQNALGIAFKRISTPLSTTPSELNIDVQWVAQHRYYVVALTTCFDTGGIAWTANNNKFMVDISS